MKTFVVHVYNYTKHINAGYRKAGVDHTYVKAYMGPRKNEEQYMYKVFHIQADSGKEAIAKAIRVRREELGLIKASFALSSQTSTEKNSHVS